MRRASILALILSLPASGALAQSQTSSAPLVPSSPVESVLGSRGSQLLVLAETARARSALARGLPSKALFHLDQALRANPEAAPLHALRGRALAELDRHREAAAAFGWALEAASDLPTEARALLPIGEWEAWRARSLLRIGAGSEARQALRRAEAQGVPGSALDLDRAWADLLAGDLEEAEKAAEALVDAEDPRPEARLVLAEARLRRGDPEAALEVLRGREDAAAQAVRARILEELDRPEDAEAARAASEEREEQLAEGRRALFDAVRALEIDDRQAAARALARAEDLLGSSSHIEAWKGVVALRRGDRDQARAAAGRALQLDPGNPIALETMGDLAGLAGREAEALRWFRAAERRDPDNADLQLKVGGTLTALGRVDDAIDAYLRARELAPQEPVAYLALSALYQSLGNPGVARILQRQGEILSRIPAAGTSPPSEDESSAGD